MELKIRNISCCSAVVLAGVNDVLKACGYSKGSDINMLQLFPHRNKNLPLEAKHLILNLSIIYYLIIISFLKQNIYLGPRLLVLNRAPKYLLKVSVVSSYVRL